MLKYIKHAFVVLVLTMFASAAGMFSGWVGEVARSYEVGGVRIFYLVCAIGCFVTCVLSLFGLAGYIVHVVDG